MPKQNAAGQPAQQPQDQQAPVDGAAGGGGDGNVQAAGGAPGPDDPVASTSDYDASKSRKKRKEKSEEPWQEKVLKFLEPVDVGPEPQKDYIDLALHAVAVQCKENLNKNEILDVVDDIQQLVNRVCRDKRRREEIQRNPPPPPAAAGFAPQVQHQQGALALPLNYNNEPPQYYQM